ncbi:hypothetical protein XENTR_v10006573 [Xenopus tropicalis]|nr:hypothetical protein XENTR_v10006573 [Xenopus tropicalis]
MDWCRSDFQIPVAAIIILGKAPLLPCFPRCTSPQEEGVADPSSTTYMQRWAAGGKDSSRLTSRDELYKHATLLKIEISWIHGTRTLLALPK